MSMVAMSLVQGLLAVLMIIVCCLLMIVVLIQKGRGGGLAGAFGGAGGSSSAFGAKTGDVFTWITVALAAVFVLLAVVGNYAFDESAVASARQDAAAEPQVGDTPAPASDAPVTGATETPATAPAETPAPAEPAVEVEAPTGRKANPAPKKEEGKSRQPRPRTPKPSPPPVKPRPSGGAG